MRFALWNVLKFSLLFNWHCMVGTWSSCERSSCANHNCSHPFLPVNSTHCLQVSFTQWTPELLDCI